MNNKIDHFSTCTGCGSTDRDNFSFWRIDIHNIGTVFCRNCHKGTTAVPDVWYGYGSGTHSEENIAYPKGHPNEGEPIPFNSKHGKAAAMKIAGVREAGDRIHGARNEDMVPKNRKTYI